jgi:Flp pilus assembly protein TadB
MPIALLAVLQLIAPDYLSPLYETGIGRLVLLLSAVALTTGGVWIHRISRMEFLQ